MSKQTRNTGPPTKSLIAIVDDDEQSLEAMTDLLKSAGFSTLAVGSAANFLASRRLVDTACLITDVNMPGMDGFELHRRLVQSGHAIPTILITAYPDETMRTRALSAGIICYLTKPCSEEALLGCVDSALRQAKT